MKVWRIALLLTALMVFAAACKTSPDEGIREAPEIGAIAPGFTLQNTNGAEVSLQDQRGRIVLINFWATWCPPCRQEMPGIQAKFEQHQGDLVVLAVDNDESLSLVKDFQDELGLTFDILMDPSARVNLQYLVRSYPTSMFVDQNGIIQIVHIGLMTEGQLDNYLAQMGLGDEAASRQN